MSPLLLAVGGWLAAGVLARECPDCVSRSWSCPKRCSPSNTRLHTFNFQYKETRCLDIIPWNGSSMQVDMNLWCAIPSTKRCRDFMCRSRISCYNMNRFTARGMISSLGFCPVPAEHSDLMSQNCDWVCKRGEPTIRCKYDFDRSGRFGIQSEIISSHAELSSEIENAIARRNLTKHALAVAQSAAQSAAAELLRTQANLSTSQADLAALKQKQVAAEKDLLSALAVKESLNKQLKENTTRLGSSLEAVYEDLKYMRKLLVEARQANQSNYKELEDLEGDLLEEQANHNVTKFALALEREDHDMTKDELEEMTAEHSQNLWQLRLEKQQHRETKQDLHEEALLHLRTKAELEEVSKTASTMTLTFVLVTSCMSLLLVVLAAAFLVTFFRKRSIERLAVVANGSTGDNNIVVGRPVEPTSRAAWVKTVEIGTKPGPTLLSCLGSPMKHPKSIGGASSA